LIVPLFGLVVGGDLWDFCSKMKVRQWYRPNPCQKPLFFSSFARSGQGIEGRVSTFASTSLVGASQMETDINDKQEGVLS